MTDQTKLDVINRYNEEVLNNGNLDAVDDLLAEDYEHGTPPPGMEPTREGFKGFIGQAHAAMPDYSLTVEDTVIEGDRIVQRWTAHGTHTGGELMGIPASGSEVEFAGISIYQVQDGKIVKDWTIADLMSVMQQIRAMPAPDQAG